MALLMFATLRLLAVSEAVGHSQVDVPAVGLAVVPDVAAVAAVVQFIGDEVHQSRLTRILAARQRLSLDAICLCLCYCGHQANL